MVTIKLLYICFIHTLSLLNPYLKKRHTDNKTSCWYEAIPLSGNLLIHFILYKDFA